MKVNRAAVQNGKTMVFTDSINFDNGIFDQVQIKSIDKCLVKASATEYGDTFRVEVNIEAAVTVVCSYTLEPFTYYVKTKDTYDFTDNPEDQDVCFYESSNIIELDNYVLSTILAYIPSNVHKKGAVPPGNGNGYRVISEDTYYEEKANKHDSRWDVLDNLDFDD